MPLVGILVSGLLAIGGALLRSVAWALVAEVGWAAISWPFRQVWNRRDQVTRWFQGG